MTKTEERAVALLSLAGKVAVVTGAASGIGRGIALRTAEMGAAVALLDVDGDGATAVAEEIAQNGGTALVQACDVRSLQACSQAIDQVVGKLGRIDILCNNVGIAIRKTVTEIKEDEWDLALDVTLKGVYLVSRAAIPHMIRGGGGSIINTGSGWALKGGPQAASYCAAKGGVLNLTRAMAIDYGKHGIRVNCVCPGDVDTPMLRSECAQLGESQDRFLADAANRPIARIGTPDDVANAVLFLASDMSAWITGAHLVVDGGGLA